MLLFFFLSFVSCGLIEVTKAQCNCFQQPASNYYQGSSCNQPCQSPSSTCYPKSPLFFQSNSYACGPGAPPLVYDCPLMSYNCPCGQSGGSTQCGCQQSQRGYQSSCGCSEGQYSYPQSQCGYLYAQSGCPQTQYGCRPNQCGCQSNQCGFQSNQCGCQSNQCGCQSNQCGCLSNQCGYQSNQCGCQCAPYEIMYYFNNPCDSCTSCSTQCCGCTPAPCCCECPNEPSPESSPPETPPPEAPLPPVPPLSTAFIPAQDVVPTAYFLPQAAQDPVVSIMPGDGASVVCLCGACGPIGPPPPCSCVYPGIIDDMASLIPANDCPCCCGCSEDTSLCTKRSVSAPLLLNHGYELDFMDVNGWIDGYYNYLKY